MRAYFQLLWRALAEACFAFQAKKELIMLFWPILGQFWFLVVTLITLSNNLSNFKKKSIKTKKKSENISKIIKDPHNKKKIKKIYIYFSTKNSILFVLLIRRIVFDQRSPVHPVSDFIGGSLSVKYKVQSSEILVSDLG